MIPKASQRANGQDLADHLMNAFDNDYVEVAQIRGAVADDLAGAFAEWEVQARGATRCSNYLYSLSINPDPRQPPLTREQYGHYANFVEQRLGLAGQPRAIIFHIKDGRDHCHIVWSRIDVERGKAIHQAFDRETLMLATQIFAREHGIRLPERMAQWEKADRSRSYKERSNLYDKHQFEATGVTKEERTRVVTDAWRASDSPQAFVQALADAGYVLATGDRPYLLVDRYGYVSALPRLIDDRSVRTAQIRDFLEEAYPIESLPDVEEVKAQAKAHRQSVFRDLRAEAKLDQLDALKRLQMERRAALEKERVELKERQNCERAFQQTDHAYQRAELRARHLTRTHQLRRERYAQRPVGLAGFLHRVTGLALIARKIQHHQDRQRHRAFRAQSASLRARQEDARVELRHRHQLQRFEQHRKIRSLDRLEVRERRSLEKALICKQLGRKRGQLVKTLEADRDFQPRGRRPNFLRNSRSRMPSAQEAALIRELGGFEKPRVQAQTAFERTSLRIHEGRRGRWERTGGSSQSASSRPLEEQQSHAPLPARDEGTKRGARLSELRRTFREGATGSKKLHEAFNGAARGEGEGGEQQGAASGEGLKPKSNTLALKIKERRASSQNKRPSLVVDEVKPAEIGEEARHPRSCSPPRLAETDRVGAERGPEAELSKQRGASGHRGKASHPAPIDTTLYHDPLSPTGAGSRLTPRDRTRLRERFDASARHDDEQERRASTSHGDAPKSSLRTKVNDDPLGPSGTPAPGRQHDDHRQALTDHINAAAKRNGLDRAESAQSEKRSDGASKAEKKLGMKRSQDTDGERSM